MIASMEPIIVSREVYEALYADADELRLSASAHRALAYRGMLLVEPGQRSPAVRERLMHIERARAGCGRPACASWRSRRAGRAVR